MVAILGIYSVLVTVASIALAMIARGYRDASKAWEKRLAQFLLSKPAQNPLMDRSLTNRLLNKQEEWWTKRQTIDEIMREIDSPDTNDNEKK